MKTRVKPKKQLGVLTPPQADIPARFRALIHSEPALTCPFLGLKDDPATMTNFASEDNFCHCKGQPRAIQLDHQQMYCLFSYAQCPIFLKRISAEVQARDNAERKRRGQLLKPSLGVVTVLTNLLGIK
ncbi:MAG: hypothetical protein Fur0022_45850 [Anaerolineales bacterium]